MATHTNHQNSWDHGLVSQIPRNSLIMIMAAQAMVVLPHAAQISLWIIGVGLFCAWWRWMIFLERGKFPSFWDSRPPRKLSSGTEIMSVHVHTVEHHNDLVIEMHDLHLVPLAGRLGCVAVRLEPGNDPAGIVVVELVFGFVGRGVVNLHFDALLYGVIDVADAKIESAVTALFKLVFELDVEIGVLFFRPQVRGPTRPALFARARREGGDAIIECPVASGGPMLVKALRIRG